MRVRADEREPPNEKVDPPTTTIATHTDPKAGSAATITRDEHPVMSWFRLDEVRVPSCQTTGRPDYPSPTWLKGKSPANEW